MTSGRLQDMTGGLKLVMNLTPEIIVEKYLKLIYLHRKLQKTCKESERVMGSSAD